jgi:hypothetical protein
MAAKKERNDRIICYFYNSFNTLWHSAAGARTSSASAFLQYPLVVKQY